MMETDYISREAAVKKFEDAEYLYDPEQGAKRYTAEDAKEILDDVPAADVRPVVRCKDCQHSYDEPGGRVCSYGPCVDCIVADDFFCADGEQCEGGTP